MASVTVFDGAGGKTNKSVPVLVFCPEDLRLDASLGEKPAKTLALLETPFYRWNKCLLTENLTIIEINTFSPLFNDIIV